MPPCVRAPQEDLAHDRAYEGPRFVQPVMAILLALHGAAGSWGAFFLDGTSGAWGMVLPVQACKLQIMRV
jgi:hypothetical protein